MAELQQDDYTFSENEGTEVAPLMSVAGGWGGMIHAPIHESLTLAALIHGNFGVAHGTSIQNASPHDWEYVRGAVWNDDPDGHLFNDSEHDNRSYSRTAAAWLMWYTRGEKEWKDRDGNRDRNPTGRSHYGDLQFLHSMACRPGESAEETKGKIMLWLEVMYRLSTEDGIDSKTIVGQTKLIEVCPNNSLPPNYMPISYLFSKDPTFQDLDVRRRAVGSMFHIIQDSYAIGHTKRTPLNPEDRQSEDPLQYKPGTFDRWGAIENFHTYGGQDTHAHSHFDHSDASLVNASDLNDLSQFDKLLGCRMAIAKCQALMALKQSGTKWDEGVRQFFADEVFELSKGVTAANSQV